MMKHIFFLIFLFAGFQLRAQVFNSIPEKFPGVSEGSCNWVDYDGDGDPDLFITGEYYRGSQHFIITRLYRNDRNNHFTRVFTPVPNVFRSASAWADANLDGIQDLFLIGQDAAGHSIARLYLGNHRTARFIPVKTGIPGLKDGSVQWGDYDGDGDPDLLLTGESASGPVTMIYRNDRHNHFVRIHAGLPGVHFGTARWADMDNDGDLDVIVSGTTASGKYITEIFMNENGKFVRSPQNIIPVSLSDIAFADYDLDGDEDFVICGETQDGRFVTRLYNNDGKGHFSPAMTPFVGVRTGSVAWGDYDHDGDPDLLITGESANGPVSRIYRNDRQGIFTDIHAGLTGLYMGSGRFCDYNLNGHLSVIISGMSSQYNFYTKIFRYRFRRVDTVQQTKTGKINTGIFTYNTKVPPMAKNIYFYVYASCYCDLYGTGTKGYHVFFSLVKRQKVQYELQRKFNSIIRHDYPFWAKFNQAEIIENGFPTLSQAEKSRNFLINEYKTKGFHVHYLKW